MLRLCSLENFTFRDRWLGVSQEWLRVQFIEFAEPLLGSFGRITDQRVAPFFCVPRMFRITRHLAIAFFELFFVFHSRPQSRTSSHRDVLRGRTGERNRIAMLTHSIEMEFNGLAD